MQAMQCVLVNLVSPSRPKSPCKSPNGREGRSQHRPSRPASPSGFKTRSPSPRAGSEKQIRGDTNTLTSYSEADPSSSRLHFFLSLLSQLSYQPLAHQLHHHVHKQHGRTTPSPLPPEEAHQYLNTYYAARHDSHGTRTLQSDTSCQQQRERKTTTKKAN